MTPPAMLYIEPVLAGDHDPLPAWTESTPGAVPYMLARPMPIETAPKDGRVILLWDSTAVCWLPAHYLMSTWTMVSAGARSVWRATHWLPLPPAPEEA